MSTKERTDYMNALAGATRSIVPDDAEFVIVLIGKNDAAHWVSSNTKLDVPGVLRELAADVQRMKHSN